VISRAGVTATLLLAVGACVPYVPRPVEPAAHPAEYRARRLDDPKLVDWVARWAARPEPRRWTDRQLALAALGLRAELERARADWRTAMAAARSAAARPQPGIEAGVERAVSGSEGQSPWVVSLAGLFGIELGGKRGARLQQARARTAVAEGELRLTAWRIVQGARAAVAAVALAEAELQQARREVEALAEVLTLERARYEEASLTLAELQTYDVGRVKPDTRYAQTFAQQRPSDGQRIPTLAALFEHVAEAGDRRVRFNIETKLSPLEPGVTVDAATFVRLLLGVIKAHGTPAALTINTLSAGDFVGEMGFMDGTELYASKVALGDCSVLGLEREKLESVLTTHPEIVYRVMRAIIRVVHQIQRRLSMQQVELSNYIYKQHGRY